MRRNVLDKNRAKGAPQVGGLRYFNVYCPRGPHKGGMSSTGFPLNQQLPQVGDCNSLKGNYVY